MRIGLAHINITPADISGNLKKAIEVYQQAYKLGCDIVVYPELTIPGYIPFDILNYSWFVEKNLTALNKFASTTSKTAAIIGYVDKNTQGWGKPLKNAAAFIQNGRIVKKVYKKIIPFSDIFYESRYFEPDNNPPEIINFKGKKILITVCADIWHNTDILSTPRISQTSPLDSEKKYEMIINISASPYHFGKIEKKLSTLKRIATLRQADIVYVNICASTETTVFDGTSFFISASKLFTTNPFTDGLSVVDTQDFQNTEIKEDISFIEKAIVLGIKDFFSKSGFEKAVIGLSGGIDSAVVLCLASKAIGSKKIKSLLLPSRFTSSQSISNAIDLCHNLCCEYEIIDIEEIYSSYLKTLKIDDRNPTITIQNIQSRIRSNILMAYSNRYGSLLLNTSNKSEIATGYSTIYGDSCGAIAPIGDVLKTDVYRIAKLINSKKTIIPQSIIKRPPTAELKPNQRDQDDLPPYSILDRIIKMYIEEKRDPEEIADIVGKKNLVFSIVKRIEAAEYKRKQMPPIIKISRCSFGDERKIPVIKKLEI
ncbi:MAG: NAD+ synthase [Elusimicrobiales bacterium]